MLKTIPREDSRALMRLTAQVSRDEDRLQTSRLAVVEYVRGLMDAGHSQAAIARGLGVTRATLNQKLLRAGLNGASKASKGKQGKQG